METIINDIEIIKEAINNGDINDALQMLEELIHILFVNVVKPYI